MKRQNRKEINNGQIMITLETEFALTKKNVLRFMESAQNLLNAADTGIEIDGKKQVIRGSANAPLSEYLDKRISGIAVRAFMDRRSILVYANIKDKEMFLVTDEKHVTPAMRALREAELGMNEELRAEPVKKPAKGDISPSQGSSKEDDALQKKKPRQKVAEGAKQAKKASKKTVESKSTPVKKKADSKPPKEKAPSRKKPEPSKSTKKAAAKPAKDAKTKTTKAKSSSKTNSKTKAEGSKTKKATPKTKPATKTKSTAAKKPTTKKAPAKSTAAAKKPAAKAATKKTTTDKKGKTCK